ncbi:MAG TPA: hypothetical protein VFR85_15005, partial [Anaeromyxobacteraceae bacterium]|nr:hypothetical protein [Anaeromyxobacteraceae bacterium]
ELSDATGKLEHSDSYATLRGMAAAYLRASSTIQFRLWADYSWRSDHYISGEPLSRGGVSANNPNYDWRYDTVGRRFRISDYTAFDLGASFVLSF